jgi:hypothetical protein
MTTTPRASKLWVGALAAGLFFGKELASWGSALVFDEILETLRTFDVSGIPWNIWAGLALVGWLIWDSWRFRNDAKQPSRAEREQVDLDALAGRAESWQTRFRVALRLNYEIMSDDSPVDPFAPLANEGQALALSFSKRGFAVPSAADLCARKACELFDNHFGSIVPLIREGHSDFARARAGERTDQNEMRR